MTVVQTRPDRPSPRHRPGGTGPVTRSVALLVALAVGPPALVLVLLVLAVGGGLIGVGLVALVACLAAWWLVTRSDDVALGLHRARPAGEEGDARFRNLAAGLCVSAGLAEPRLYVIDDEAPNALVVGRSAEGAAIAVTTGLLAGTDRVGLEGVLAHALSRIALHDLRAETVAVVVIGLPVRWMTAAAERRDRAVASGDRPGALGRAAGLVLLPFAGLFARVSRSVTPGAAHQEADLAAVRLTRYPPGLLSALEMIEDDPTTTGDTARATAPLWFARPRLSEPGSERAAALQRRFEVHPPLSGRIEILREL